MLRRSAKIQLFPNKEEASLLRKTMENYTDACDFVAAYMFENKTMSKSRIHNALYSKLRTDYGLKAQMAESVLRKVIRNYQAVLKKIGDWQPVYFYNLGFDVVKDRSFSFTKGKISINTVDKRIKIPYENKGLEKYFDGSWEFGDSRVISQHNKWYLCLSCKKEIEEEHDIKHVVGINLGVDPIATVYDCSDKTKFFSGKEVKTRRGHLRKIKEGLVQKGTPSSMRRLNKIVAKERRWIRHINHQITKEIIDDQTEPTLFVLKKQTGKTKSEKVIIKNDVLEVNWAFWDFKEKLEYKAEEAGHEVIYIDSQWLFETCPKCGNITSSNWNKHSHSFECQACYYESNDSRIAAMNLCQKGLDYLSIDASGHALDAKAEANQPTMREDSIGTVEVAPMPPKVPQAPMPKV